MRKLGIFLSAIVFTVMAYVPVMAESIEDRIERIEQQLDANWKFYGNVMMSTFYEKYKAKDLRNFGAIDDKGTTWGLNTDATIGATVEIGNIEGVFEYEHNVDPSLSYLYGVWNFMPEGKLVVGYDDAPLEFGISNQVYYANNGLSGFGSLDGDAAAQIKLIYKGFQFALIDPNPGMNDLGFGGTDVVLPRIEAAYDFSLGPLAGKIMGGYKTFKVVADEDMPTELEETVNSWITGLGLLYDAGPFYFGINGFYGENIGAFGQAVIANPEDTSPQIEPLDIIGLNSGMPYWTGNEIIDAKTFGVAAALGYKHNDMLSFEVGYGYQEDKWKFAGMEEKLKGQSYYLNATITVAKGFYIVPEVGVMRYKCKGLADIDAGKLTYFGAKWQIEF